MKSETIKTDKPVIIINGRSGVGKDTLIKFASEEFKIRNVSSIDRVKEIATFAGWDGVKDERGRKLLINIKDALIEYGDKPTEYMLAEYQNFILGDEQIMFVHIREPKEIQKLMVAIRDCGGQVKSMLVTRETADKFNLTQDDNLMDFEYDLYFANDKDIDTSGKEFVELLKSF